MDTKSKYYNGVVTTNREVRASKYRWSGHLPAQNPLDGFTLQCECFLKANV